MITTNLNPKIMPFRFTHQSIKALPKNQSTTSTELEVSDTEMIGLKCLVGRSGNKRFLFRYTYQGKKRSLAVGRFPEVSVGDARNIVTQWKGLLCCGIDPKTTQEKEQSAVKNEEKYEEEESTIETLTVSQFFWQLYLPYAKQRKRSWDKDQSRFECYIEKAIGHIIYKELKAIQIYQIQDNMLSGKGYPRKYSPATCNRALALLKTMGNLAYRWDYLPSNEAMKVTLLKENNQRERFFTQEEMQKLLFHAEYYPNKEAGSLIALLLLTGARRNELQQAKWTHLNLEEGILFVPLTKSGKPREIYLSEEARHWITRLLPPINPQSPFIFARKHQTDKPIAAPRWAFNVLLDKAEIEDKENICFHTARHSVASLMISSGKFNLYDVKAQLAHSSIQSSERYAKLTKARQKETGQSISEMLMPSR
jgi:phage integrase family protein